MSLRRVASCLFLLLAALLANRSAQAQPACVKSYITVSNASGKALFQVAATVATPVPAQTAWVLYYAGNYDATPTAVFRSDVGLTLSAPTPQTGNCNVATLPNHIFTWLGLQGGASFATVQALSVDALSVPGSAAFYNTPSTNPSPTIANIPLTNPGTIAIVRKEMYCPANVSCNLGPAAAQSVSSGQQQQQQQALPAGTCGTVAPYGYPVLTGRNLHFHRKRYTATLTTWAPIDNSNECSVRQLLFNVPDDLEDLMGVAGSKHTPQVSIVLKSVNPANPPVTIYVTSRAQNGVGYVEWTMDSQTPLAVQVQGDYTATVTITGHRKN